MIAFDGNFAFAFGAGMLATVNPCGFVMLPTYLLYFLGVEADDSGTRAGIRRALAVSGAVTAGFFVVFLTIGLVTRWGFTWIRDEAAGWLSIGIGGLLLVFGVVTLFGIHLPILTPKLDAGGRDRSTRSMFLYGISYAIASIGCTLPTFTGAVLGQVTANGFLGGVLSIAMYGLGMGLVLSALTISLAVARTGLLRGLRRVMQHIDLVSGVVLVLAGAYLVLYGWTSLDVERTSGIVTTVEEWQSDLANWVSAHRRALGVVFAGVTLAGIVAVTRSRRRPAGRTGPGEGAAGGSAGGPPVEQGATSV